MTARTCASCHAKEAGFTGGKSTVNLAPGWDSGTVPFRYGQRKPNSYSYELIRKQVLGLMGWLVARCSSIRRGRHCG